jgi:hypothetical protein
MGCLLTAVAWHALLHATILTYGAVNGIIDAGAQLAGIPAADIAKFVFQLRSSTAASAEDRGRHTDIPSVVVYYDGTSRNCWVTHSVDGQILPLRSSPVKECDAFVVFDEQHCRGADMKLRLEAVVAVTLGPGMCKDKFMQAAGR